MAFVAATSFRVAPLARGAFGGDAVVCVLNAPAANVPAAAAVTMSSSGVPLDGVTRRAALASAAAVAAGLVASAASPGGPVLIPSAQAAAAVNLGSSVEPYKDLNKGFTILRPQGWNQFEATAGQYDIKWQDLIQPLEIITVLTTPVSKGKTLKDIGTPEEVGAKLAKSRRAEVVSAVSKDEEGLTYYTVELKNSNVHQLTTLVMNKSKLYSVNVSAAEAKWPKREKLLRGVADSFKPSL